MCVEMSLHKRLCVINGVPTTTPCPSQRKWSSNWLMIAADTGTQNACHMHAFTSPAPDISAERASASCAGRRTPHSPDPPTEGGVPEAANDSELHPGSPPVSLRVLCVATGVRWFVTHSPRARQREVQPQPAHSCRPTGRFPLPPLPQSQDGPAR